MWSQHLSVLHVVGVTFICTGLLALWRKTFIPTVTTFSFYRHFIYFFPKVKLTLVMFMYKKVFTNIFFHLLLQLRDVLTYYRGWINNFVWYPLRSISQFWGQFNHDGSRVASEKLGTSGCQAILTPPINYHGNGWSSRRIACTRG